MAEVATCRGCPLSAERETVDVVLTRTCGHPQSVARLDRRVADGAPPEWCPLRAGPLLVRLYEWKI